MEKQKLKERKINPKSHITPHTSHNSGITLVALIITIIVLLILAVVAIRAVQGDGILQYAKDAKQNYSAAQEKEKVTLATSDSFLSGKGVVEEESLTKALNDQFGENNWTYSKKTAEYFIIKINSTERRYKIYTNGSNERDDIIEISDSSYFFYSGSSVTGLTSKGKTELTALAGKSVKLIIPETYNDTTIDTIGAYAFDIESALNNLSDLSIEATNVTSLGDRCFSDCTSLVNASLPNVTSLGDRCFFHCTSLANVSLPNVQSVGIYSFSGCSGLTNISLPNVMSLGDGCFNSCSSLTNVSLLNVTSLGSSCFSGCSSLTNITFPNAMILGDGCFINCMNLTNMSLPKVTSLGSNCFQGCTSLTNVSSPNVTSLGNNCFLYCTSLTTINMPKVEAIGKMAFSKCGFTKIEIPSTVETTGAQILYNCSNLKDIYIPARTEAPSGWDSNWKGGAGRATVHWNESMPNE